MAGYTYTAVPNVNLLCCICRTPFVQAFTTRTCAHTFCRECITTALGVSQHCPIDRSPLTFNDLTPADPLVRNLVDELEVECPNRHAGCEHTCQRQLLASHLEHVCSFVEVPCLDGKCSRVVHRKDARHGLHQLGKCIKCEGNIILGELESHEKSCSGKYGVCSACEATVISTEMASHESTCPSFIIPCTHRSNGCPWKGHRQDLLSTHIPHCAYEAIKGFFEIHDQKVSSLSEENMLLRLKVDALDGMVTSLKRELAVMKVSLGPWYRPEGLNRYDASLRVDSSDGHRRRSSEAVGSPSGNAIQSQILSGSMQATTLSSSLSPLMMQTDPLELANYFPPAESGQASGYGATEDRNRLLSSSSTSSSQYNPTHHQAGPANRSSIPLYGSHSQLSPSAVPQPPPAPQTTPVAPLNLSTTIEGSLSGLRESIVTVSSALDSLGRRQDVILAAEAMRTNEEIMSLRAIVHGLRIQVHAVMMDHNAQVTGRSGESSPPPTWLPEMQERLPWMSLPYPPRYPHPTIPPTPPSIPKL